MNDRLSSAIISSNHTGFVIIRRKNVLEELPGTCLQLLEQPVSLSVQVTSCETQSLSGNPSWSLGQGGSW